MQLIPGCNEEAFLPLVQMASELPVDVRFIELMPIGEGRSNRGMDNRTLIEKLYATFPGTVPDPAPTLLAEAIRSAASGKPEAHSFDRPELITEKHRMSGIGG